MAPPMSQAPRFRSPSRRWADAGAVAGPKLGGCRRDQNARDRRTSARFTAATRSARAIARVLASREPASLRKHRRELHVLEGAGNCFLHAVARAGNHILQFRIGDHQAGICGLEKSLSFGARIQCVQRVAAIKNEVVDAPFQIRVVRVLLCNLGVGNCGGQ